MLFPPSFSHVRAQQIETPKARSRRDSNAGFMVTPGISPQHENDETATELATCAMVSCVDLPTSSISLHQDVGTSGRSTYRIFYGWQRLTLPSSLHISRWTRLPITSVQIGLLSNIQAEGTEEMEIPAEENAPVLLQAINCNGLERRQTWRLVSLTWHGVHERHACDGDLERLFGWRLPICVDNEGLEALKAVCLFSPSRRNTLLLWSCFSNRPPYSLRQATPPPFCNRNNHVPDDRVHTYQDRRQHCDQHGYDPGSVLLRVIYILRNP